MVPDGAVKALQTLLSDIGQTDFRGNKEWQK
jgi:hypothetical protein